MLRDSDSSIRRESRASDRSRISGLAADVVYGGFPNCVTATGVGRLGSRRAGCGRIPYIA